MKICVTSQGKDLSSEVDPRFGRCKYFIFVDSDSLEFEAVENLNAQFSGGAGIQPGQFMASKGVKAILTGNIGPNAFGTLQAAKIEVFTGASGNVKDVIEKYKKGKLISTQGPSVGSKFGMPGK